MKVFRPPYGKMTLGTAATCLWRGWRIITWTHASGDTYQELPDIGTFVQSVHRAGGGVVLMHDADRQDPGRTKFVLDTTTALIDMAKRNNWRFIHSLDDWKRIA